jgi:hypothetical protein
MNFRTSTLKLGTAALATMLSLGSAPAQETNAKQDMKSAGHDTKNAASETGHGIASGTKKGYRKTKHGIKKAYHKTANTLDPHKNSQDEHHQ